MVRGYGEEEWFGNAEVLPIPPSLADRVSMHHYPPPVHSSELLMVWYCAWCGYVMVYMVLYGSLASFHNTKTVPKTVPQDTNRQFSRYFFHNICYGKIQASPLYSSILRRSIIYYFQLMYLKHLVLIKLEETLSF